MKTNTPKITTKILLTISLMSTICFGLTIQDNQVINITGRMSIGNLICLDNSIAYVSNLTGYQQILSILAKDNSQVLFDVPVLKFSYQDGLYGAGFAEGICFNGQEFYCDVVDSTSFSHIRQIPEPIGLILLAFSAVFYKKSMI